MRKCLVDAERTVGLIVIDGYVVGTGNVIAVARTLNLQVDRRVESLQVRRIHVNIDGLRLVHKYFFNLSYVVIIDVEFQVSNSLLSKGV